MPFLMIRNDITKVAADAIVNPANRNLLQGSGTSRAIYQAAGEQELTAACEAIGRCDLGRAVCAPAFGLSAKYVFHAVCPAWHGGGFGEAEQLVGAYHSALELAAEYHCESVAFPLLSSGNYGYPKEQAFRIAVDTITQYVMEHDLTVYLVLYDRDSLAVSRKLFVSVEEYIDDHYVAQNDVLCVNEVEACALAGTETFEADAVLTLLHEKYPQTRLLLTAGSAGSYYLDAERRLFVPCEKVQAVDTTAAGDTYSGYFLAGLCNGSSVEDAMRLATKAAGIAVQRKGAAASIPEIKELK